MSEEPLPADRDADNGATPTSPGASHESLLAIEFVGEAGRRLLESSISVSEVQDELKSFLPTVGIEGATVDANLSTLIISYTDPRGGPPVTTVVGVSGAQPDLKRQTETLALLARVMRGDIALDAALVQLRTPTPPRPRWGLISRLFLLISAAGWALYLDGANVSTLLVACLAVAATFLVTPLTKAIALPAVAGTFAVAIMLGVIPNLIATTGFVFSSSAATLGGLYIFLPGLALTGAVIDGVANAPLSAVTRGIRAIVTAGALALGVVVGSEIGGALGVDMTVNTTATPFWLSVVGAFIGVLGIAVAWASPRARVLPIALIGAVGWLVYYLCATAGVVGWVANIVAAAVIGVLGVLAASLQGGGASVYVGAAILPLVPGYALYSSMIALAQGPGGDAGGLLGEATVASLAIAGGVAVGLALGRNITAGAGWVAGVQRRRRHRRRATP